MDVDRKEEIGRVFSFFLLVIFFLNKEEMSSSSLQKSFAYRYPCCWEVLLLLPCFQPGEVQQLAYPSVYSRGY